MAWLGGCGSTTESRLTGQTPRLDAASSFSLAPAEEQLLKAMEIDDSLFATEEQNLFIDEVRETERWSKAFCDAGALNGDGEPFDALAKWTEAGLACLMQLAEKDDGPLGWTSDQHAFAACVRVILCSVAVLTKGKLASLQGLLDSFMSRGRSAKVHGFLLGMATAKVELKA